MVTIMSGSPSIKGCEPEGNIKFNRDHVVWWHLVEGCEDCWVVGLSDGKQVYVRDTPDIKGTDYEFEKRLVQR